MRNYNNLVKNEYLNSNINNENSNANLNIENQIKNPNIIFNNKGPKKAFRKRNNIHSMDFRPSYIKTNNFINETNPNYNENFGNFINNNNFITNNINDVNIPGIIGGNDDNYENQFNELNRMKRNETFSINEEDRFKHDDNLREDKKNNLFTERKNVSKNRHKLTKNCLSSLNIEDIDNNRKINNLKRNQIKLENNNINNITFQTDRINRNENENQYKIPQFNQTINNENIKEREIISPYYKNLYRKYKRIFGDINIFNSVLILLNNILDVNNHLDKDKRKGQIELLDKTFGYCFSLASILYHSNQYIFNKEKIHSKDIFSKYSEFTNCFSKMKYGQNDKCLFDINNMEFILEFIYTKLNYEFTSVNKKNDNNINNNYNTNNSNYLDEFKRNHKSFISDMFTGFYQYNNNSSNYQQNFNNSQNNNNFKSFSFIKFNLNEINQFYDLNNTNEMNLNNFYNNINLYSCFDYTFKDNKHSICSLPKILTVVLTQTDKCNFILNHEINLKYYIKNGSNNNNNISPYILTSIFCQISYNKKFINYIFDPNEGSWFSLSDQEIKKVDSIDINAIPLILIYQLKNIFEQEYIEIKIEDKLCAIVNFQSGMFQKTQLFFDTKDKIRDVRNKIKSWFDIKESFTLLINGCIAKDYESLSKVLEKGYNILVLPKSN